MYWIKLLQKEIMWTKNFSKQLKPSLPYNKQNNGIESGALFSYSGGSGIVETIVVFPVDAHRADRAAAWLTSHIITTKTATTKWVKDLWRSCRIVFLFWPHYSGLTRVPFYYEREIKITQNRRNQRFNTVRAIVEVMLCDIVSITETKVKVS